jgi:hypothetical protein
MTIGRARYLERRYGRSLKLADAILDCTDSREHPRNPRSADRSENGSISSQPSGRQTRRMKALSCDWLCSGLRPMAGVARRCVQGASRVARKTTTAEFLELGKVDLLEYFNRIQDCAGVIAVFNTSPSSCDYYSLAPRL